jgi:chromosome partitioning protein
VEDPVAEVVPPNAEPVTAPPSTMEPGIAPSPATVEASATSSSPHVPGAPVGDVPATSDASAAPEAGPTTRIIALANQKGGVGKTTTTVNMGAALAELDHRVLIVDLDPQGNATTGLGINYRVLEHTMYDVLLHQVPIDDCIEPTEVKGLFVAPASLDLAGAEIELVPAFNREAKLKRALEDVVDAYDYILIDCPPSLGLLTVNGLVAATEVMVPIQCEYYALEGLAQLTRNVDLVRENLNPTLQISGIVLVMYDSRTKLGEQVVQEVRDHFGDRVCRNMIPRNVKLSEAPSFGQPITIYDSSSRGAVAYRELAREVSRGS